MAAKEKSQQQANQKKEPPKAVEEPVDLLSSFDAPSKASDPPPAYDTNFLPPPPPPAPEMTAAPPAPDIWGMTPPSMEFDSQQQDMSFPPPPPINAMAPPPPPPPAMEDTAAPPPPAYFFTPPAASAPSYEDLLDSQQQYNKQQQQQQQPVGGDYSMPAPMAPPQMAPEIDDDILAALDPAERAEILEEQRKIMEQIEKDKKNNDASSAAAKAMAFDQRSGAAVARVAGEFDRGSSRRTAKSAAPKTSSSSGNRIHASGSAGVRTVDLGAGEQVPLHGQEKTQQAIAEGNALIVQCLNCQNWMQVTKDATLMFCPTCQVVSPVLLESAATAADMEQAAQEAADAQLAEKLQAEEYGRAKGGAASAASKKKSGSSSKKAAKLEKGQAVEQSWYDWFMGTPTKSELTSTAPVPARGSAEIRPRGLVAASTGAESYGASRSYDDGYSSATSRGSGGGARMAESKSMFACVTDAVGTAATSIYTMNQDEEGNVHGVDASGLLAMPNVSRQRD